MIVLGIDPSTKTGIAVCRQNKGTGHPPEILFTEEINFPTVEWIPRAHAIGDRVREIINQQEPDFCVIEGLSYKSKFINADQVLIANIIRYHVWCLMGGFAEPAPSLLKKWATGKGDAKKKDIIRTVKERWGWETNSDNIADAIVMSMYGLSIKTI